MATSEEKQELVEKIKGPRYYRISLTGYGGEGAYMSISKEAHDFWKPICEEHGDNDLVNYMVNDDPDDYEFENVDSVPPEADFLQDPDSDYKSSWYEAPTEYEHQYGVTYDASYINVDEVDSDDYMSNVITEVIENQDLPEFISNIEEETEYVFEGTDFTECYAGEDVEYIAQMYSSEKGGFFDGIIETTGDFDPKKLKFYLSEYDNGEETITSVEYDGVEIDNQGGDTNGKGYYAAVWKA
jgi:hypothetical protein